ncbi:MAG: cytochrome c oxidase assembly protein [Rhodocyclaceae bacterium]|nr:cytochrome c oxidase assembly protein [Rhodocyclaceae bacterium]
MSDAAVRSQANRRLALRLLGGVAAAFAFGFLLVPLYDVICDVTGLNGKTRGTAVAMAETQVDTSRTVQVEFISATMPGMPWEFSAGQPRVSVHPGEITTVHFRVRNMTASTITGQAVPSVSPGKAASHLQKLDCFCFKQQTLAPGEVRDMPVSFIVDRRLPDDVSALTLSYSFFAVDAAAGGSRS